MRISIIATIVTAALLASTAPTLAAKQCSGGRRGEGNINLARFDCPYPDKNAWLARHPGATIVRMLPQSTVTRNHPSYAWYAELTWEGNRWEGPQS